MKNRIFFWFSATTLAVCFFLLALAIDGQAQQPSKKFIDTYNKVCELNKGRFLNLNEIQIGDLVLLPALDNSGDTVIWIAKGPDLIGTNDCIWNMTERYIASRLETMPIKKYGLNDAPKMLPALNSDKSESNHPWWLPLLLPFLAILFLVWFAINAWYKRKKNPNSYPAVGENITDMPREQAMTSLQRFLKPGDTLISLHRGKLNRLIGQTRIAVRMFFGDGFYRNVWIYSGEGVATAIIENAKGEKRTEHFRSACSNGFASGVINIPTGWEIIYNEGETPTTEEVIPSNIQSVNEDEEKLRKSVEALMDEPESEHEIIVYETLIDLAEVVTAAKNFDKIVLTTKKGKTKIKITKLTRDKK